jgi:accessory gene regulator protein AgrB
MYGVTIDGFGLVTGFIGLIDTVLDYTLQFTIIHTHAHAHTLVFTLTSLLLFLSSGFQQRTLPYLNYQLLTATVHDDWTPAVL